MDMRLELSPVALDRRGPQRGHWQAAYRAKVRANLADYLPDNPHSSEERALLREICAVPDSVLEQR